MVINEEDIKNLAQLIVEEIGNDFQNKYITHNLINTIQIIPNNFGGLDIKIPAQIYDLKIWRKKGVIVHKPGSYASLVDKTGGFSGTHKNYVEKAINRALDKWRTLLANKNITMIK